MREGSIHVNPLALSQRLRLFPCIAKPITSSRLGDKPINTSDWSDDALNVRLPWQRALRPVHAPHSYFAMSSTVEQTPLLNIQSSIPLSLNAAVR